MADEIRDRTVYMLYHTDCTDVYIGSTSQTLEERLRCHKNAGDPSMLKWYGSSKLYEKMRAVGVQHWRIVPLLTFACDQKTIFEFEWEWVKAAGAGLNTLSPVNEDLGKREYDKQYCRKNIETKRYYCGLCHVACVDKSHLKRHFDTLKHSYAWLNVADKKLNPE